MENSFKELPSKELIEVYNKNKEFINFLEKEYENAKRMRDANE